MKRISRTAVVAIGLGALALVAGCHSSTPEAPVENNMSDVIETTIENTDNAVVAPVTTNATGGNTAAAVANHSDDFSDTTQTLDDADATGMTSRLPQDNETQPAQ